METKIKGLLTENERVIGVCRIHWVVFAPSVFYCFLALMVAIFFHPLVGGVILFLTLYPLYNAIIYYYMTYLVLTNKKVLSRIGFLARDWTQMGLERIENAFLEEPIIGRYLGYSTVVISGIGSGAIAVTHVLNGAAFIKKLEQQIEDIKEAGKTG